MTTEYQTVEEVLKEADKVLDRDYPNKGINDRIAFKLGYLESAYEKLCYKIDKLDDEKKSTPKISHPENYLSIQTLKDNVGNKMQFGDFIGELLEVRDNGDFKVSCSDWWQNVNDNKYHLI
jgi:hypothetical protein